MHKGALKSQLTSSIFSIKVTLYITDKTYNIYYIRRFIEFHEIRQDCSC